MPGHTRSAIAVADQLASTGTSVDGWTRIAVDLAAKIHYSSNQKEALADAVRPRFAEVRSPCG